MEALPYYLDSKREKDRLKLVKECKALNYHNKKSFKNSKCNNQKAKLKERKITTKKLRKQDKINYKREQPKRSKNKMCFSMNKNFRHYLNFLFQSNAYYVYLYVSIIIFIK